MLKTGYKLIKRERFGKLSFLFLSIKLGKKIQKNISMEEANKVKRNLPILGPIIFFPNPAGLPFNEHNFSPSVKLNLLAASSYN